MSPKWRYIFGATTIGVIVGGTTYAIIKSIQMKKQEEEAISLSEAREIVNERVGSNDIQFKTDIDEVPEAVAHKIRPIKAFKPMTDEEVEQAAIDEMDEDDDAYPDVDERTPDPTVEPLTDFSYYEEGIDPKGDNVLRHDPNSVDAKHQFIRMELADWEPEYDTYRIMLQLFEIAFVPMCDGDEILRTQIIDYKVQFFGFNSRWNREVSFADVIFHYARAAEFNCGKTVSYWVEYFLSFNEFEWDSTSKFIDTMVLRLNSHTYFNEERQTFGLFGLTREGMDQAIRIANRNVDRSVTYEIEFNEFLKLSI